jgi:hypothetical protein
VDSRSIDPNVRTFRPSDVFGILVRTIGMIIAVYGFYSLADIVAAWQFALPTGAYTPPGYTQPSMLCAA